MPALPGMLQSQDAPGSCAATPNVWAYLRHCAQEIVGANPGYAGQALHAAYKDVKSPQTLNSALGEFAELTGTKLFGDLHLHFKGVGSDAGQNNLALGYDWTRNLARTPHRQGHTQLGYSAEIEATGTVTPSARRNPEDFLDARLHAHLYLQSGGAATPSVVQAQLAAVADSIDAYERQPFGEAPGLAALMAPLWDSLSTQVYITAGADLRAETTQDLDQRQYATGVRVGVDVKAWNPHSVAARLNVFDYPAAAIRFVTGADKTFRPNGAAWPTVLIAVHHVAPGRHPSRAAAGGDLDPFPRFALEAEYRSQLFNTRQGKVWLYAMFRHFSEIDPTPGIVAAGLHRFNRLLIAVEGPGGMHASWATGHPSPLEADQNDSWGVGFKLYIQ